MDHWLFGRNLAEQTAGIWHLNMNALLFATSLQLLSIIVPKDWRVLLLLSFPFKRPPPFYIFASKAPNSIMPLPSVRQFCTEKVA